jgi:polysaccharide biosynthesis/export protein
MAIRPSLQGSVELTGAVHRPRSFEHTPSLLLTDVLPSLDELLPGADPEYVLVRREPELGRVEYLSADLRAALQAPKGAADLALRPRDRVVVLSNGGIVREPVPAGRDPDPGLDDRRKVLQPLLTELRAEAQLDSPTKVVTVNGVVRAPGDYPLEAGMTVGDLLRAGGRPSDAAYPQNAELTRYTIANGERRQTEVVVVDLAAVLRGEAAADLPLQPFDVLTVKLVPEWAEAEFIDLVGEVRFPGRYPIRQGETLRGVIERAGGFTPAAFPEGAVFTRASLRQREKEQLDKLATRLQSDLAVLALRNVQSPEKAANGEQALIVGRSLLMDLQNAKPVGRLVIDATSLATGAGADVELRDGDALVVPRAQQAVTVLGEVQSPTSHLWRSELGRNDYIGLSGGLTAKADDARIYVVRADGSVIAQSRSMFSRGGNAIRPGDTIVAPLDTERVGALSMWTSITQIIYNLAIAVAAVNSF